MSTGPVRSLSFRRRRGAEAASIEKETTEESGIRLSKKAQEENKENSEEGEKAEKREKGKKEGMMTKIVRSASFGRRRQSKKEKEEDNVQSRSHTPDSQELVTTSSQNSRAASPQATGDRGECSPDSERSNSVVMEQFDPRASSVLDSKTLSGWLCKRHHGGKQAWAKRYFAVDDERGTLLYLKSEKTKKTKASVILPLSEIKSVVAVAQSGAKRDKEKFRVGAFVISCPPIHLTVAAEDEEEMRHWIVQLTRRADYWRHKRSSSSNAVTVAKVLYREGLAPQRVMRTERVAATSLAVAAAQPELQRDGLKDQPSAELHDHKLHLSPAKSPVLTSEASEETAPSTIFSSRTAQRARQQAAARTPELETTVETVELMSDDDDDDDSPGSSGSPANPSWSDSNLPPHQRDLSAMLSSDDEEEDDIALFGQTRQQPLAKRKEAHKPSARALISPFVEPEHRAQEASPPPPPPPLPPQQQVYERNEVEETCPEPRQLRSLPNSLLPRDETLSSTEFAAPESQEVPEPLPAAPAAPPASPQMLVGDGIVADSNFVEDDWDDEDED